MRDRVPTSCAAELRAAGREPPVPFSVTLLGGGALTVLRLLRVLPGKRLVGEGEFEGRRVLAKLFVAPGSARHCRRERRGLAALATARIPTPPVVAAGALAGEGHAVLTEFLVPADSLADRWADLGRRQAGDREAIAALTPALALLGRMHAAGLAQDDLHLGNFLQHDGKLYVVDGDAVRRLPRWRPLREGQATANLALLLAQLSPGWDHYVSSLTAAYGSENPDHEADLVRLQKEVGRLRARRLRDYLAKARRDCTLFQRRGTLRRVTIAVRTEAAALEALIRDPDRWVAAGTLLKDGRTCTVARVDVGGRALVVKRYNIKGVAHALSRALRPTRAVHSWIAGHRLRFLGIGTPAPLALVEERFGPVRRRAWLVTEYCPGPDLARCTFHDQEPPVDIAAAVEALFDTLHRQRISHGDLKATNLLWHDGSLSVIDLDAMVQHRFGLLHARAWRRDRERLLRNWPAGSALHRWLDGHLPQA